MAARKPAAI
ncbi:hypothetical protein AYI68_g4637, partial [Smittium mucronatum]